MGGTYDVSSKNFDKESRETDINDADYKLWRISEI